MVHRLVANLYSNAVHEDNFFVSSTTGFLTSPKVRIRLVRDNEGVRIIFRDAGKGMSPETLARVRGVLADPNYPRFTTKEQTGGLMHGRGLRTIRRMCEALGASITVESRLQNATVPDAAREFVTTFTITLPAELPAHATEPSAAAPPAPGAEDADRE